MAHIEQIRHSIIDKVLNIENEELLAAFNKILGTNAEGVLSLTKEQTEMLKMSDNDILNGDILSQSEIDKMDAKWLS